MFSWLTIYDSGAVYVRCDCIETIHILKGAAYYSSDKYCSRNPDYPSIFINQGGNNNKANNDFIHMR